MYTLFNTSIVHVRIKFRLLAISHRQSPRARSFAFTSTRYLGPRRPLLTTLHPPHLTSSDFQCLSGKQQHHLPSSTNKNKSCTQVHYKHSQGSFVRFPEHAQGFFYLHPGPPHAPVAGELRFRTVPSQDPADFSSGHDLLDANYALPWRIPLPAVLTRASYGAFADLLMRKPSPAMLSIIAEIEEDRLPIVDQDATIMHSIGQPLYADLQKGQVHFRIAKGVDINPTVVIHLFRDQRRSKSPKGWHYPYTGSMLFRFERAPDEGYPRCYVRVLDIIKPIKPVDADYDGHLPLPIKGELLRSVGGDIHVLSAQEWHDLPDYDASSM